MKKLFALLVMVLFLFPISVVRASSVISVSVLKYEPSPALPGKYMDLWVLVANEGDERAENLEVSFVDSFPFRGVENTAYNLTSLPPYEDAVFKFRVFVDSKASMGENYAYVKVTINKGKGDETSLKERLPIEIKEMREALSLVNYSYDRDAAYPGGKFTLNMNIANLGNEDVHDIIISLDLTNTPFTPSQLPNVITIPYIAKGEIKTLHFPLSVKADCESSSYLLPLTISYVDSTGNSKEIHYNLGVVIEKPISYLLSFSPSYLVCPGKQEITLRMDNNGIGNIKLATAHIEGEVEVIGSSTAYIGNIDSDDYGTVTFEILCSSPGEKKINVTIKYRDELNNLHVESRIIKLKGYTPSQLRALGIEEGSNLIYYVIALILILAVYFSFKFFKKYKKK